MGNNEIKKVAVVVGHTVGSKGAQSPYLRLIFKESLPV